MIENLQNLNLNTKIAFQLDKKTIS
jgi:hypothetical protein